MAGPPRFTTDSLLDAAVDLAARGGPEAVHMTAVAEAAGAPSGSVYHRFPGRTALLAELWLRTVEDFQAGWRSSLEDAEGIGAARAAARHVVAWARAHPGETALLLYGPDAFGRAEWGPDHTRRARAAERARAKVLRGVAADLSGEPTGRAFDTAMLALVETPLALVRRHLRGGGVLPSHAEALAEDAAQALLGTLRKH